MDKELRTEFRLDDRIVLRAWREQDIEGALRIVLENREHLEAFMIWMTPDYSIADARKFIEAGIKSRTERKSLGLGIFRDEELIGSIGLNDLDDTARKTEIGYWIARNEEGHGIITRACQALIDYAFDELGLNRVQIRCSTENLKSGAIPERLGFKREAMLRQYELIRGRLHDFYVYGLLAEDPRLW
jgi:ribosomal-protein-serine acetyltransferase